MAKAPKIPETGECTFYYALAGQNRNGEPGLWFGEVKADMKDGGKNGLWYAEKDSQETQLLISRAIYTNLLDEIQASAIKGTYYVFCLSRSKRDSLIAGLAKKALDYHNGQRDAFEAIAASVGHALESYNANRTNNANTTGK